MKITQRKLWQWSKRLLVALFWAIVISTLYFNFTLLVTGQAIEGLTVRLDIFGVAVVAAYFIGYRQGRKSKNTQKST